MKNHIIKSLWLLGSTVVICCLLYPLAVWAIGQTFFPFTANGSMVTGPNGKPVGSLLIAQPFTKDEYFWPRPSAASYDASASASSTLAASNYLLRDRVARTLGPIVKYASGPKKGQLVAPDVEAWFQQDRYQGNPHIVAQWSDMHNELAQSWVSADPSHAPYITDWAKAHKAEVADWVKQNPGHPAAATVGSGRHLLREFLQAVSRQVSIRCYQAIARRKEPDRDRARGERFGCPVDLLRYVAAGPSGRRPRQRTW